MNDRALREILLVWADDQMVFQGKTKFDITVASEIMAVLCCQDLEDLKRRN